MEKKDWLLLVLAAAKKKGLTPVQLQKSLFLIGAEIPESIRNGFYNFVQCDYGPSDKAIYADAQTLKSAALIRTGHKATRRRYFIASAGERQAKELASEISKRAVAYLRDVVAWCTSLSQA